MARIVYMDAIQQFDTFALSILLLQNWVSADGCECERHHPRGCYFRVIAVDKEVSSAMSEFEVCRGEAQARRQTKNEKGKGVVGSSRETGQEYVGGTQNA